MLLWGLCLLELSQLNERGQKRVRIHIVMDISLKRQCKRVQSFGSPFFYLRKKSHIHNTTCTITKTGHTVSSKFTCLLLVFGRKVVSFNHPSPPASIQTFICFIFQSSLFFTLRIQELRQFHVCVTTHWTDHFKYCDIYLVIFALCASQSDVPGHFDTVTESL